MLEKNADDALFTNMKYLMFELINLIEIKIDVGYILEEIEEIALEVRKLNSKGERLGDEMKEVYKTLHSKYRNKLASFLSPRESNQITGKIKNWIQILPSIF
ncbi:MAG: hypothetical protein KGD64_04255 [Candidatus Heimdallarchaeota archaeon]|nr:hypothetical protein [Candidatus Heimdallarchaeota archaeon]